MINKTVLITALARDCNYSLIRNIPLVEKLRESFAKSYVLVVENDSVDGTKETLINWQKQSAGVKLVMNDFNTLTIPEISSDYPDPGSSMYRISKMVKYRNVYIDYANNFEEEIDYLIVIDIDIISFSVSGVINAIIKAPSDWGGLFANGCQYWRLGKLDLFRRQYDLFAFKENITDVLNSKYRFAHKRSIDACISKNAYYECISAFGGVGIYKWNVVRGQKYVAIQNPDNPKEALAEHIPFNESIISKGYKNYIVRDMCVDYGQGDLKMFLRLLMP